jgi:O-antigen ligase
MTPTATRPALTTHLYLAEERAFAAHRSALLLAAWILARAVAAGWGPPWLPLLCDSLVLAAAACARPAFPTDWRGRVLAAMALWGPAQILLLQTVSPMATLRESIPWATAAALFFLSAPVGPNREARRILRASIAVLASLLAAGAILLPAAPGTPGWGPLPNRNHQAALYLLALPILFHLAARTRTSGLRALATAAAGLLLVAGVLGGSRAGAALLLLESVALVLVQPRWPLRRSLATLALALLLALATLAVSPLRLRLADRDPLLYRSDLWASTLELVQQRPLIGYGLGTFEGVYPSRARFDTGERISHAHQNWLEWAAEGGVPFATLAAALLLGSAHSWRRHFWALGLPFLALHSFVDYPLKRHMILYAGVVIFALLPSRGGIASAKSPTPPTQDM